MRSKNPRKREIGKIYMKPRQVSNLGSSEPFAQDLSFYTHEAGLYFTYMELNNKHTAVIGVGVLILVFIGCAIWYMATHQAPAPVGPITAATTTPTTGTAAEPQQIVDNGKYYEITATYPGSTLLRQTTSPQADAAAVATLKTFVEQQIARFKDNGNFENLSAKDIELQGLDAGRKYAFNAEYKTYQGAHTISYVYTLYEDTLGAHPNAYYRTFTFDTATGQDVELSDLFASGNYLETLSTVARADLPNIIRAKTGSAADTDYIASGTLPEADSFQNWYLDGAALVLVFPPYQVGPYAIGTILDPIPLSKLSNILKATYVP